MGVKTSGGSWRVSGDASIKKTKKAEEASLGWELPAHFRDNQRTRVRGADTVGFGGRCTVPLSCAVELNWGSAVVTCALYYLS